MFSRRTGDLDAKRFWRWFAAESEGLASGIEALARGEADADWLFADLATAVRRYDPAMTADIVLGADGYCELSVSGGTDLSLAALMAASPTLPFWRIASRQEQPASRRIPYRAAPTPSLDLSSLIQARHEAYAC